MTIDVELPVLEEGHALLSRPTYYDIQNGCYHIAMQIARKGVVFDIVVGLSRGGLIPAVELSNILDVPLVPATYSSFRGQGDNKNHSNRLPDIFGNISSGTGELPALPRLLVVDDICDSGYTMMEVKNHYTYVGHVVYTAALYYKTSAVSTPDIYWQLIGPGAPWILFPWEKT